jgi:K+-sensing histidine kinase KdpD
MADRRRDRRSEINGEGLAWGAGAFGASVLLGIILQPVRGTIGLENVTIVYLLIVIVAAAYGGRGAGLFAALVAALSYDYFLTTPYNRLVIDTLAQVVTVALLFAAGVVASLAGRARRRSTVEARQHSDALHLLNAITQMIAAGGDAARAAAEGLYGLLDADRVIIKRTGPTSEAVVADVGRTDQAADAHDLPRLDQQGRLPRGFGLWRDGLPPKPPRGAVIDLVRHDQRVGELVVVTREGRLTPTARLTLASVAHALAAVTPRRPAPNGQQPLAR